MIIKNKIPKSECSKCGHKFEVGLDAGESGPYIKRPGPGTFLMCVGCDTLFRYQEDMSLKLADWTKFNDKQLISLKASAEVNRQMREAIEKSKHKAN